MGFSDCGVSLVGEYVGTNNVGISDPDISSVGANDGISDLDISSVGEYVGITNVGITDPDISSVGE